MTDFKAALDFKRNSRAELEAGMVKFSRALQVAMGLSDQDREAAGAADHKWSVTGYTLASRNFRQQEHERWIQLLYAYPAYSKEPGWSGEDVDLDREDWAYIPGGTTTIILPRDDEQRRILAAIRGNPAQEPGTRS